MFFGVTPLLPRGLLATWSEFEALWVRSPCSAVAHRVLGRDVVCPQEHFSESRGVNRRHIMVVGVEQGSFDSSSLEIRSLLLRAPESLMLSTLKGIKSRAMSPVLLHLTPYLGFQFVHVISICT